MSNFLIKCACAVAPSPSSRRSAWLDRPTDRLDTHSFRETVSSSFSFLFRLFSPVVLLSSPLLQQISERNASDNSRASGRASSATALKLCLTHQLRTGRCDYHCSRLLLSLSYAPHTLEIPRYFEQSVECVFRETTFPRRSFHQPSFLILLSYVSFFSSFFASFSYKQPSNN